MRIDIVRGTDNYALNSLRQCLRQVLAQQNKLSNWSEWMVGDRRMPSYIKRRGRQGLYINGVMVWKLADNMPDPSPSLLGEKITELSHCPEPKIKRRTSYHLATSVLPAIGLMILPKCAICGSVYIGLMEWVGLSFSYLPDRPWLLPLMLLMMIISVALMAVHARQRHGFAPVALALLSSLLMIAGKLNNSNEELYFGGGVLLAATIWNITPWQSGKKIEAKLKAWRNKQWESLQKSINVLCEKIMMK